jgi:hypothetical protein
MKYSLMEWIDSAINSKRITQRRIGWINSQGGVSAAISRAERNGTRWIKTQTHLALIHGERVTIGFSASSAMIAQGSEVTFRNHTPPDKAVARIPNAQSTPLRPFRFNIVRPKS